MARLTSVPMLFGLYGASPSVALFRHTCTPLVPEVMLNLSLSVYQPPTKMALLSEEVSALPGSPVVSQ